MIEILLLLHLVQNSRVGFDHYHHHQFPRTTIPALFKHRGRSHTERLPCHWTLCRYTYYHIIILSHLLYYHHIITLSYYHIYHIIIILSYYHIIILSSHFHMITSIIFNIISHYHFVRLRVTPTSSHLPS